MDKKKAYHSSLLFSDSGYPTKEACTVEQKEEGTPIKAHPRSLKFTVQNLVGYLSPELLRIRYGIYSSTKFAIGSYSRHASANLQISNQTKKKSAKNYPLLLEIYEKRDFVPGKRDIEFQNRRVLIRKLACFDKKTRRF